MGNALTVFEVAGWDPHPAIDQKLPLTGKEPTDPMDRPLSCYWISSGHNSYLTGNQLNSNSGVKTIISCLREGCRVIELDVYNKAPGFPGPVCKHGGTLTRPVAFKECVRAVKDHAFHKTSFPAIITIENHTDEENQRAVASILKEVLGDLLFIPRPEQMGAPWLSPAQLQRKVLIRGNVSKCVPELKDIVYIRNTKFQSVFNSNSSDVATSSSFAEHKVIKLTKHAYEASGLPLVGVDKPSAYKDQPAPEGEPRVKKGPQQKSPVPMPGSKQHVEGNLVSREDEFEEVDESQMSATLSDMYKYTSRHLMRVYPGGMRVDSSNYNPCSAWALGASFAALNWQNWDKSLWLNEAKFALNGGCGYVLKPEWMINPSGKNPLPTREPLRLGVLVHSAYAAQGNNCACFKDDLYVQVEVHGMPMDYVSASSKIANNTGRLKLEQLFEFEVAYPELAILLITIKDDDLPGVGMDDTLGYVSVPVAQLRDGSFRLATRDRKRRLREDRWVKVTISLKGGSLPPATAAATLGGAGINGATKEAHTVIPGNPPPAAASPPQHVPEARVVDVGSAAAAAGVTSNPLAAHPPGNVHHDTSPEGGGKRERKRMSGS